MDKFLLILMTLYSLSAKIPVKAVVGQTVITNNLVLGGRSITQLNIDSTLTSVANTSIPSTRAVKMYIDTSIRRGVVGADTGSYTKAQSDSRYASLTGNYVNPSFINSLPTSKITGLSNVATSGAYIDLSGRPTGLSSFTNDMGFLTGINSTLINTALGYTPYNGATNPNGYLTGVSGGYAITVTGGTTKNVSLDTTNIMTVPRAMTAIGVIDSTIGSVDTKTNGKVDKTYVITVNSVGGALSGTSRNISITTDNVPAGTNKYLNSLTLTTAGSGAATYTTSTNVLNIPSTGGGTVTSVGLSSTDLSVSGSPITTSGSITANLTTTGISAGTYEKLTVDTKGRSTGGYNPTINNNVSRSLNTGFTISATQEAFFCYTVQVNVTIGLTASTGTITPQYSTNAGSTWISLPEVAFNPPLLTVGLLTSQKLQVNGWVPANALVRILTTGAGGGTTSFTYITGQERY